MYSVTAQIHVLIREYMNTHTYSYCRIQQGARRGGLRCARVRARTPDLALFKDSAGNSRGGDARYSRFDKHRGYV